MNNESQMEYEHHPLSMDMDETDIALRAYLAGLEDGHLAAYQSSWNDDEVVAWDNNFRSDGYLMLVCCERHVDVAEFRSVLEEHLALRQPK